MDMSPARKGWKKQRIKKNKEGFIHEDHGSFSGYVDQNQECLQGETKTGGYPIFPDEEKNRPAASGEQFHRQFRGSGG
jgi:hypothetical protein